MRLRAGIAATLLAVAAAGFAMPTHAALEDALQSNNEARRNLARLIVALRALQQSGTAAGSLADVTNVLDSANNTSAVAQALRSLLPDVVRHHAIRERRAFHSQSVNAARSSRSRHQTTNRQRAPASSWSGIQWLDGTSTYQSTQDLWFQAYTDDAEQDDADGLGGFDAQSDGFTIGLDIGLTEALSLELSVGTLRADIETDVFGDDETDGNDFSIGMTYTRGAHSWSLSYGQANVDIDRQRFIIVDTDAGFRRFGLSSDIETEQRGISLGYAGYFTHASGLSFSPFVAGTYAQLETDDYVERGAGELNLTVQTDDETQVVGTAGLAVSWSHTAGQNWLIAPSVGVAFEHDFKADATQTLSRFRDTPFTFTTNGYAIEENRWRFNAGVSVLHISSFGIGVSYEAHRKGDYSYDAAIMSVQIRI